VSLANPLSGDLAQLRTTLLVSLLDIAQRNRAQGAGAIRLFETGAVYLHSGASELPREPQHLGAILSGPVHDPTWRSPEPTSADFFTAKGVLAAVLDGLAAEWSLDPSAEPFLHPGRCARIKIQGHPAGWLGELHPTVAREWDLPNTVAAFELDLDVVPAPPPAIYTDLTSFPEVREDLAVVVDDGTPAQTVVEVVRRAGAPLLSGAEVFDVYRDPDKLGAGKVSLAIRLLYRAPDRTLTDEEVARQRHKIAGALEQELGGRVRDSR
jgi:phenylalanyl-tRNA synthetase beta chain